MSPMQTGIGVIFIVTNGVSIASSLGFSEQAVTETSISVRPNSADNLVAPIRAITIKADIFDLDAASKAMTQVRDGPVQPVYIFEGLNASTWLADIEVAL